MLSYHSDSGMDIYVYKNLSIVCFIYVQFNIYYLYLNKAIFKKKKGRKPSAEAMLSHHIGENKSSCLLLAHTEPPFPP